MAQYRRTMAKAKRLRIRSNVLYGSMSYGMGIGGGLAATGMLPAGGAMLGGAVLSGAAAVYYGARATKLTRRAGSERAAYINKRLSSMRAKAKRARGGAKSGGAVRVKASVRFVNGRAVRVKAYTRAQ